ncbi:cupin domain-containing protein [Streptomyces sp. NPDC087844]|uniref:cupin domain-containing protein n=1 Tax=Streptomyces sp. NPDC087844 TaxID=3365805 RepID=UPI0037FC20B9
MDGVRPADRHRARLGQTEVAYLARLYEFRDRPGDLLDRGVRVDPVLVRFTPGARTNWHSHARGQVLHVTDGVGLVGTRDGRVVRTSAGETVKWPASEEHRPLTARFTVAEACGALGPGVRRRCR